MYFCNIMFIEHKNSKVMISEESWDTRMMIALSHDREITILKMLNCNNNSQNLFLLSKCMHNHLPKCI